VGKGKGKHHRAAAAYSTAEPPPALVTPAFLVGTTAPGYAFPYGPSVEQALADGPVQRCVSVIAGTLASMPWQELEGVESVPASRITERPCANMTRREWVWKVAATLALENVCYLLAMGGEDDEGAPWSLVPVAPQAIAPADYSYDPWGMLPPTRYRIGDAEYSAESLVILRRAMWPGVPDHVSGPLRLARATFGAVLAAGEYAAKYWAGGGSPITQITVPQAVNGTQAEDIRERWRQARMLGPDHPAVLGGGATAAPFGVDPTAAAAVDARREHAADIARYFGVPTRLANAPASDDETYANVESEGLDLLRYCLIDYMGSIQDAITGLLPDGRTLRLDPTAVTRGLQGDRYTAWSTATGSRPWMLPEEVREAEHLPPLTVADFPRLAPPPAPPPPRPLEREPEDAVAVS
jgi:HK97 family phage portal protein